MAREHSGQKRREPAFDGLAAFTLLELLTSMSVLLLILLLSSSVIQSMQQSWMMGQSRVNQFRSARDAFERITFNLAQATLNTYQAYVYTSGGTVPVAASDAPQGRMRFSELHFITGPAEALLGSGNDVVPGTHAIFFQAPLGISGNDLYRSLNQLLCGSGYFVEYSSDQAFLPMHISKARKRFRLMEYRPSSERNKIYTVGPGKAWFSDAANESVSNASIEEKKISSRPAAENIVALVISPRGRSLASTDTTLSADNIAPFYSYDSQAVSNKKPQYPQGTQHLLPQEVSVTLVAIDEPSAQKLETRYPSSRPPLLHQNAFTRVADFDADLRKLEEKLNDEGLNYRVFTHTVPLRNALWEAF